jgi:hypothetical protein
MPRQSCLYAYKRAAACVSCPTGLHSRESFRTGRHPWIGVSSPVEVWITADFHVRRLNQWHARLGDFAHAGWLVKSAVLLLLQAVSER